MSNINVSSTDSLLPRIELSILVHGISATKFGWRACEDPSLVFKLRQGRKLKGLRGRVERFLDELDKELEKKD